MPNIFPEATNKIKKITGSKHKLNINFLIMSYDGNENYHER